jgi:hypothetical protein
MSFDWIVNFLSKIIVMHNLDRTMEEMEFDGFPYQDEMNWEFENDYEYEGELGSQNFSEEEELELATELLSVASDEEMDQFLGKLVKRAWSGMKRVGNSPLWQGVKRGLGKVAKVALPIAGKAAGAFFGGPVGGALGGKLGTLASRLFEMELEGLSPEDQELELARRFVRFAASTAVTAAGAPSNAPVAKVVNNAIKKSAKQHIPGLIKQNAPGGAQSGRWMRRGDRIILFGV